MQALRSRAPTQPQTQLRAWNVHELSRDPQGSLIPPLYFRRTARRLGVGTLCYVSKQRRGTGARLDLRRLVDDKQGGGVGWCQPLALIHCKLPHALCSMFHLQLLPPLPTILPPRVPLTPVILSALPVFATPAKLRTPSPCYTCPPLLPLPVHLRHPRHEHLQLLHLSLQGAQRGLWGIEG